jgi:N-acetylglucosaminyldiphosphoundecaprenol N-acetyl-beta-D-mannosaminyltransferase
MPYDMAHPASWVALFGQSMSSAVEYLLAMLESGTVSMSRRRVWLFGLPLDDLSMPEAIAAVEVLINAPGVHQHASVNVSKVVQADRDAGLRDYIRGCDLVTADGQPIVWASRLFPGARLRERITGIDLMTGLIERAGAQGYRLYLLGGRATVVRAVVDRITQEHPGAVLAGWRDGYWAPDEEEGVVQTIRQARPDILFVALGSPAKERFIAHWGQDLGARFVMGVGGSFDVYAGVIRRAPRWAQRLGLEWLVRTAQEPRRLLRRYLTDAPKFAAILIRARVRRR